MTVVYRDMARNYLVLCDGLYLITLQLDKRGFLKKVNKGEPDIALCIPNMPAPGVGAYYMCAPAYMWRHWSEPRLV